MGPSSPTLVGEAEPAIMPSELTAEKIRAEIRRRLTVREAEQSEQQAS
jgi:hypothetical protein